MCDTFVATQSSTADSSIILAKNSDREPNEVQLLEHHGAASHKNGDSVQCTHITIPQVAQTNEILISRPFWMWGCEMGVNDKGVAIGNEAVFTREPCRSNGLLGMDLIRLALERSDTAKTALQNITDLLAQYGQGGKAGYTANLKYHNSFIIADPNEAWVLETADYHWAAVRVDGVRSISNGLTIGEEYDLSSPGLEDYALKKCYIKKNELFNFKHAFSDRFYTFFSKSKLRQNRTSHLLNRYPGNIEPRTMMQFLRDHGNDEKHLHPQQTSMGTVCMHASMGPLRPSQSTSALVAHIRRDLPTFWATGTSGTCTGFFKPFYLTGNQYGFLSGNSSAQYSSDVLWWRHELLHRQAIFKNNVWNSQMAPLRDKQESEFIEEDADMVESIINSSGPQSLIDLSLKSYETALRLTEEWTDQLLKAPEDPRLNWSFRSFWKKQNRKSGIRLQ